MKVPTNLRTGSLGFNMTPMIDVVFLLIIFFLVSSHLAKRESQLELPLPTAKSGQPNRDENVPRLTVNVLRDGTLLLAGRTVNPSQLAQWLRRKLDAVGTNLQVRIRADRATAYRFVEPIMLACARVGIWDVAFAIYRPEDVN